jgi:hypothetical protein
MKKKKYMQYIAPIGMLILDIHVILSIYSHYYPNNTLVASTVINILVSCAGAMFLFGLQKGYNVKLLTVLSAATILLYVCYAYIVFFPG